MKRWLLIAVIVLVLVGVFGMKKAKAATSTGPFPIAKWANYFGVPIDVLEGVVRTESNFKPGAKNLTGGDLARGGAWGLAQMTLETAKGLVVATRSAHPDLAPILVRFDGTGPSLLDPDLNLLLAASLLASNYRQLRAWPAAVLAYNRGVGGARTYLASNVAESNVYVQKVFA
jgi:soluble lytic murein transglycosylase-like protein